MPTCVILPDDKDTQLVTKLLESKFGAKVVENYDSLLLSPVDERVKRALDGVKQEGLIKHKYDYIWIKHYLNEQHEKIKDLWFSSVKSYRDYVYTFMGHHGVASVSMLSEYNDCVSGTFPNWTFSDIKPDVNGKDATERLRRINLVRRFVNLFNLISMAA